MKTREYLMFYCTRRGCGGKGPVERVQLASGYYCPVCERQMWHFLRFNADEVTEAERIVNSKITLPEPWIMTLDWQEDGTGFAAVDSTGERWLVTPGKSYEAQCSGALENDVWFTGSDRRGPNMVPFATKEIAQEVCEHYAQ